MPSSSSVWSRGASIEAAVASGSSSSFTLSGMTTADSGSDSPMFSEETSSWTVSGISFGSASTLTSRIV